MDIETKLELIKGVGEEIISEEELRDLLETNNHPIAYDGFEPSGIAHIPFGLLRSVNINDMLRAGVRFNLLLADYFAFINNKMGGDLEKIKLVGNYFIEVWKACGVDTNKVKICWSSKEMDSIEYWDKVLKVSKKTTINRAMRATTIMGRTQGELQNVAQLFYPAMQVSDIFHLDVDICQLGLDQRRANILAREVAQKLGWKKPVVVSHHMIMGLQGPQNVGDEDANMTASKMSKSKPGSAIYMHDSYEEIKNKINNAYCPSKIIEGNPLIDYAKHLIFKRYPSIKIERSSKFGGDLQINGYEELAKIYLKGELHPLDLKNTVAKYLDYMIKPVREYFEKNSKARKLYEEVKKQKITR